MSVAIVLLAAGGSSRMRGGDKLLTMLEGEALLRRSARTALASRADTVVAVTGANRVARQGVLADLPIRIVPNAGWAEGMGTSIATGATSLGADTRAVIVMPADMPDLTPALLDRLITALPPDAPHRIIRPRTHRGQPGNPVLFGAAHLPALGALRGDAGARAILSRHSSDLFFVDTDDDAILTDLDTPEAWAVYRERRRRHPNG